MKTVLRAGFMAIVVWVVATGFLTPKMSDRRQAQEDRKSSERPRRKEHKKVHVKTHKKAFCSVLPASSGGLFQNVLMLGHHLQRYSGKIDLVLLIPVSVRLTSEQRTQLKDSGWHSQKAETLPASETDISALSILYLTHYKLVTYVSPYCFLMGGVEGAFPADQETVNIAFSGSGVSFLSMKPSEVILEEILASIATVTVSDSENLVEKLLRRYAQDSQDLEIAILNQQKFATVIDRDTASLPLPRNCVAVRFDPGALPWKVPSRSTKTAYYFWQQNLLRLYTEIWPFVESLELESGEMNLRPANQTYADLVLKISTVPGRDCTTVCSEYELKCDNKYFSLLLMKERSTLASAFGNCPATCYVSWNSLPGIAQNGSCFLNPCEVANLCPSCSAAEPALFRLCPCGPFDSNAEPFAWDGSLIFNHFPAIDSDRWLKDVTY